MSDDDLSILKKELFKNSFIMIYIIDFIFNVLIVITLSIYAPQDVEYSFLALIKFIVHPAIFAAILAGFYVYVFKNWKLPK
jgi:hypothetical protein